MKLQTKLLSLILPLITVSTVLIGFAVFSYLKTESKNSVDQEAYTVLRQVKSSIGSHVDATKKQLALMAENPSVQKILSLHQSKVVDQSVLDNAKDDIATYFRSLKGQYPSYEKSYFMGKNIDIIAETGRESLGDTHWPILLVNQLKQSQSEYTRVQTNINGTPISAYAIRVFDTKALKNPLIGYLVITENYSFVDRLLHENAEYKNNSILLANQEYVIRNPEKFKGANKIIDEENPESFFMRHHSQILIDGEKYFYYMATLGKGDSIINIVSSKAFDNSGVLIGSVIIAIGLLLSFLISILLVVFINKVVVNRITHIDNISKRIAQDDLSFEINTNSQDEIGHLARSFTLMRDSLTSSREKINQLAFYDELTGLANRRSLNNNIERAIEDAYINQGNVAVIMMDLDDFKDVNDIYGHHVGDDLLIEISKRLEKSLSDTLSEYKYSSEIKHCVCRIAGDEFTVVISGYKANEIIHNVAKKIVGAFDNRFNIDGIELNNSVSLGVALYPENGLDRHILLKHADMAMYEAKNGGKNGYEFFHDRMTDKIKAKKEMERKIIKALDENEFTLYFQPKVAAKTKSIVEFEALIRWNHPDGMISPGIFIPFAEENGLINAIGNWVVKELCMHIKELECMGWNNFKISFNTSPQQLQDKVFTRNIEQCINKFSINPSHLEMEITEHSLAKDLNETIRHLNKIKAMGIDVALDDFGTGYSSLSYLEKMPIDTIKIDRSFVSNSNENPERLAIIATIVTLAKGLGMRTVAEGVETEAELKVVTDNGCDLVQGYYYHSPLPFNEMKKVSDFNPALSKVG